MKDEIREAITAGRQALRSLREAERKLKSAGKWGWFDILGGDGLSGILKHMRLREAKDALERAQIDLRSFSRELSDTAVTAQIDIDGFLTFADFFFDGFIADALVQSRISQAKTQTAQAIAAVRTALDRLEDASNA